MFACADLNNFSHKQIFYVFLSISGLKNTRFYKDGSFIHQNLKENEKLKLLPSFHSGISTPSPCTQHANIPFDVIIDVIIILLNYICALMITIILINYL
jgi:hypothetical protein